MPPLPDFLSALRPAPRSARFTDPGWFVWCGSVTRADEGPFHLFYSRWPKEQGFEAWVSHSEVAHAVADTPLGPFRPTGAVLPARGVEHWDGLCTHNPTVHRFDNRYYLYYMGNTTDGGEVASDRWWRHRNRQRIGVAVADRPDGPWTRFDQPLVNVSPDPTAPDALMTSNPSVTRMNDGRFLLVYKGVGLHRPLPFGGPVVHLAAVSESPLGPFRKEASPLFTAPGSDFPAEDPFVWAQDGCYWALVKDFGGHFTGAGASIALFQSVDGYVWNPAPQPLASRLEILWEEGRLETLARFERPQLWMENGVPQVLYGAAMTPDGECFNAAIPLDFQQALPEGH